MAGTAAEHALEFPHENGAGTVDAHGAAGELVRLLVDAALRGPRAVGAEWGSDPDVVLDVELDGYRCTLRRTAPADGAAPGVAGLTPREREIARMVAGGYANKTIARVLDISAWTVGTHLRRIFLKLGVSSRAAMVARLLEDEPSFARTVRARRA